MAAARATFVPGSSNDPHSMVLTDERRVDMNRGWSPMDARL